MRKQESANAQCGSKTHLYKETVARWIEVSIEIYRALNLERNESIDGKNTSMDRGSIKNLSAKQRAQKFLA